jgi:hypothetical protein
LRIHQKDTFSNGFYVLMLKINKKSKEKIHFQGKITFEMNRAP